MDDSVEACVTYFYWLEDVDVYGQATRYGPVMANLNPLRRLLPARLRPMPSPPELRNR